MSDLCIFCVSMILYSYSQCIASVCICSDTRESIGTTIKTISKLQWGQFPQINGYEQTFSLRYHLQLKQHLLPRPRDEYGGLFYMLFYPKRVFNPNFTYCEFKHRLKLIFVKWGKQGQEYHSVQVREFYVHQKNFVKQDKLYISFLNALILRKLMEIGESKLRYLVTSWMQCDTENTVEISAFYCHDFVTKIPSNQLFTKEFYSKLIWRKNICVAVKFSFFHNVLSHFFGKNFVKTTFLVMNLLST